MSHTPMMIQKATVIAQIQPMAAVKMEKHLRRINPDQTAVVNTLCTDVAGIK